jgi:photosystem II stability/assembly factor-like uncharacterized protein
VGDGFVWNDSLQRGVYAGIIVRTTNGGKNWIEQKSGTACALYGVSFTDANSGTAVGDGWNYTSGENESVILRTTDGGKHWIKQLSEVNLQLNDVCFTDANNGTVVGYGSNGVNWGGIILRTIDAGKNWIRQPIKTNSGLSGVWFTDTNNGTVVGDGGTILRTTNGGVTFVEEEKIYEIPTDYVLFQNYPNPFNPSTKIKYSIPASLNPSKGGTFVTLRIYDLLGREIETLVNEEKQAGTYEVTWSATELPSGVYFYQIKTGNFIETKKMVLIR